MIEEITGIIRDLREQPLAFWQRFILRYLTPGGNPLLWIIINFLVVLYSIFLLFAVGYYVADEGREALRFANQSYLWYDFLTTIVWVLETFLGAASLLTTAQDESEERNFKNISISALLIFHFVVSIFFLVDSFNTLITWKWKKEDTVVDAIWVVINLVAYIVALIETVVQYVFLLVKDGQQDLMDESVHYDPLLDTVLPFYDSVKRQSSGDQTSKIQVGWKDWVRLLETSPKAVQI